MTPSREARAAAALAGVTLLLMLAVNAVHFRAPLHETLEMAANSLLVQDAKRFALLTGSASSHGFNHPGPALLMVLAAGEALFHDVLGWVASPVAGQVIAACVLASAWLGLLCALLARSLGGAWPGLAAAAVFVALTTVRDAQYLTGLGFPHLYYMPFAVFVVATGRVATGAWEAFLPAAIAAVFLVHGHASFIALTLLMAGGALAIDAWRAGAARPLSWPRHAASMARAHRRALAASAAVLALGALPIVLDTVLDFPGALPKYAAAAAAFEGHTWGRTADFISRSWFGGSGPWPAALAVAACAALAWWPATRSLGIGLLLGTLAAFLYARTGTNELAGRDTGLFHFAVPALAVATLAGMLVARSPRIAASGAAVAGLAAIASGLALVPSAIDNHPDVPRIAAALRQLPARPAVLDLDNSRDGRHLWGLVAGVASHSKRAGERLLCVRQNWHVLFTRALQCGAADVLAGSAFHVTAHPVTRTAGDGVIAGGSLWFVPHQPTVVAPGAAPLMIVSGNAAVVARHMGSGWAQERDFAWSVGPRAHLHLRVPPMGGQRLALGVEVGAFLPRPDSVRAVDVTVNGYRTVTLDFDARHAAGLRFIPLEPGWVRDDGHVHLEFGIRHPESPRAAGVSVDARPLGFWLRSVRVVPVS